MKKINLISMIVASFAVIFSACNNSATKKAEIKSSTGELAIYTCPMHPEVQKDKPGECPICGMDLVKKETSDTTHMGGHMDTDTNSMHNR